MGNIFDKYQKIIANAKQDKGAMEKQALENPEEFLKNMGIDPKNINLEQLKKTGADLTELVKPLEKIFNGKNFKDLNNYHNCAKFPILKSYIFRHVLLCLAVCSYPKGGRFTTNVD